MKIKNFLLAYIQVLFVSLNTIFLAKNNPSMVFVCAFLISYIWTHNVKKVAFGGELDKIIYAIGASLGSVSGLYLSKFIL
jgi:hypothetical protein